MKHEPKDYKRLIAECRGFLSETQLEAHFELYQGYVKKLNEIEEKLKTAPAGEAELLLQRVLASCGAASPSPTTARSCTSCTSRTWARQGAPGAARVPRGGDGRVRLLGRGDRRREGHGRRPRTAGCW